MNSPQHNGRARAASKEKRSRLWIVPLVLILAAAALVTFLVLQGRGPEAVAEKYLDAEFRYDLRGLIDYSAYNFVEAEFGVPDEAGLVQWAQQTLDDDEINSFSDLRRYYMKQAKSKIDNTEYSLEVLGSRSVPASEWASRIADFGGGESFRGVRAEDIEQMTEVTVLAHVVTSDSDETHELAVCVIKQKGEWGVLCYENRS